MTAGQILIAAVAVALISGFVVGRYSLLAFALGLSPYGIYALSIGDTSSVEGGVVGAVLAIAVLFLPVLLLSVVAGVASREAVRRRGSRPTA